jgi:hypothetical protein
MTQEQLERELLPLKWRDANRGGVIVTRTDIGIDFYIQHLDGVGFLVYGIGEYRDFDVIPIKKDSIEEAKGYVWEIYVSNVLEMFYTSEQHGKQ